MDKISKAQMRKIYALAREKKVDNDLLHSIVKNRCGQEHISGLTVGEAAAVIDHLEGRGNDRTVPLPTGRPLHLATKKQMYKIHELEKMLGWLDNPARLRGFCKKYAGVDNPDWMTKQQAWRIIEGMKALVAREDDNGITTMG